MKQRRLSLLLGAALVLVITGLAHPAIAAPSADTTRPTVKAEPFSRYVSGSSVSTDYCDDGTGPYLCYFTVDMFVKWTATDASGICSQTITVQNYDSLGGDYDPILGSDTTTFALPASARTYAFSEDLWDYGRVPNRFVVRSTDCAGNTRASIIVNTKINIGEDTSPQLAYTGAWNTANFAGFSAGTTRYTVAPNASVSFHASNTSVAVTMELASNRGSADIYVDGVRRKTVNTYAATKSHHRVVWQALVGPGDHVIKVVNLATPGRPRIDIDSFLY